MKLTKEEFCSMVGLYKSMTEVNNEMTAAFSAIGEWIIDKWLDEFYAIIDSLCELPVNENQETVLDWYCFDTDFGRYMPTRFDMDGNEFEIVTEEELYDYIVNEVLNNEKPD